MPRLKKYKSGAEKQRAYRERKSREKRNIESLRYCEFGGTIKRPALRYPGGKFKISSWIISHFPRHLTYVEPFCGGASILLRKTPSQFEVINDLNSDIVNFFDVLRHSPDELIRAIQLTPYSREVHARAHLPSDDKVEKALRLYIRLWQSFGTGVGKYSSGWRYQHSDNRGASIVDGDWNTAERLYDVATRLKMVQIENDVATAVIKRFDKPHTLFYVDPPYMADTRASNWKNGMYQHEMTDSEHIELANVLQNAQGMVALSGYDNDIYNDLFSSWEKKQKSATTNGNSSAVESLWLNPVLTENLRQKIS